MKASDLHVVAVYNNPRRFWNRQRLLMKFVDHMISSGVSLTLVEHVIGERDFVYDDTHPLRPYFTYHKIRGDASHELWLKEGLQKYGTKRLPESAKYIAIIDTDITFTRPNWAVETIDMLQCHRVGQPWSYAEDVDTRDNSLFNAQGEVRLDRSFCKAWVEMDIEISADHYGQYGQKMSRWTQTKKRKHTAGFPQHPGYAWAFRKEVWDAIDGLPDWLVLGSADQASALAFTGHGYRRKGFETPGCLRRLDDYARLCDLHVRQDIGVVDGKILHGFHGLKAKRFYLERCDIALEAKFDPDHDIGYDHHGLPYLKSDNRILRDGIRRLSVQRDEDSSVTF